MPRGMKKGLDTKKFDRCVSKVKGRSGKNLSTIPLYSFLFLLPSGKPTDTSAHRD